MVRHFESVNGALVVSPSFEEIPLQPNEDALKLSIQKWYAIVDHLQGRIRVDEDGGYATCALCQRHNSSADRPACADCPIAAHVGRGGCDNEEYHVWFRAVSWQADVDILLQAALGELWFLIRLDTELEEQNETRV